MPSPRQLSRQLRLETDPDLRRRRWVVGLSDVGVLAGAGGRDRAREQPLLPLAMAGKVAYDAYVTVKLAGEEWQETERTCAYCQAATLASLASLALVLPEAARAARSLLGRG